MNTRSPNSPESYEGKLRWISTISIVVLCILSRPVYAQHGPVSLASSADNRFEFFLPSSAGIRHSWQGANGQWVVDGAVYLPAPRMANDVSPFEGRSIAFRSTTVSALDVRGRLMVAWIANGRVYYSAANGAGSSLPASGTNIGDVTTAHSLAIATNKDGRLELFVLSKSGYVSSYPQEVPGVWSWGQGRSLSAPGIRLRMISVTPFRDGRLALIGVTKQEGRVLISKQVGPNGTPLPGDASTTSWTPWDGLGGVDVVNVVAKESVDHRLEIMAYGGDSVVYHRYEIAPDLWKPWGAISPEKVCSPIQFFTNSSGRMEVIARRCTNKELIHISQVSRNGGWGHTWAPLIANSTGGIGGPIGVVMSPSGVVGVLDYRIGGGRYFSKQIASQDNFPTEWSPWEKVSDGE